MLCRSPFLPPGQVVPVPCGRCMPCRISKRRLWTSRLLLESMHCGFACFVTLTYRNPPEGPPRGNLAPRDVVLWLKRLRKGASPVKLRYFLVGEYGEETLRPHYHCLLFGISPTVSTEKLVSQTWSYGFVQLGDVTQASIRYCVGYTLKRMTRAGDTRLCGRVPEFARMSRSLGKGAALLLAKSIQSVPALKAQVLVDGVPSVVQMGRRKLPLGRHLREVAAREAGVCRTTAQALASAAERVRVLQEAAGHAVPVQEAVKEPQAALNVETRERLFSSRRKKL